MIFILRSDGAYASYGGMSMDAVMVSLALMGLTGAVITEAEFNAGTALIKAR
mgnify:CR=1 FL=1